MDSVVERRGLYRRGGRRAATRCGRRKQASGSLDPSPPPLPASLPPLSTLSKQAPSPLLFFNLIEVLYAYALAMRLFNGEWQPEPAEVANHLTQLSGVLRANAVFASLQEAALAAIEAALKVSTLIRAFACFSSRSARNLSSVL